MNRPGLSIRTILLLTISALTLLIVVFAAQGLYVEWERLDKITTLKNATRVSDMLFDANEKLTVERDIALTILDAADRESIERLKPRLLESRASADAAMNGVLHSLTQYDFSELPQLQGKIITYLPEIQALRRQIDNAIANPNRQKNPQLTKLWYRAVTDLSREAENLWLEFVSHFSNVDAIVTQHMRYKHFLRTITDTTAQERAIIGRLIAENADPTPNEFAKLLQGQGIMQLSWDTSYLLAKQSGLYPSIESYYRDAKSHYATLYDMVHGIFYLPGGKHASAYPIGADTWLELSTEAAESLDDLKTISLRETRAYVEELAVESQRAIVLHLSLLFFALTLCTYSFWLITHRVINPINNIITALLDTMQEKSVSFEPLAGNQLEEIKKLAQVLDAFRKNLEMVRNTSAVIAHSESRLRAVVDHTLDGLITINEKGIIESFNPACVRIFGYQAAEAIGQNVKMLMPEPYHSEHDGYLSRYVATGDAHVIGTGREVRGRRKDGTTFPMDLSVSAFELEDVRHFSGIIRDITERKEAERKIAEEATRLLAVMNTVLDGLITIDASGIIQSFNRAAVRIFGYQPEEVIGQNVKILMPEPYHAGHDGYLKNYLTTGNAKVIGIGREVSARRKDGSIFPMELGVNEMSIEGERMFVGTIRDITELKEAERQTALLAAIVEFSDDAIISKSLDGTILSWNNGAEHLFGYSAAEAIGQHIKLIIPFERMEEEQQIIAQIHAGKPVAHFDTMRRTKDGRLIDISLSVSPILDTSGKVIGASKTARDITERKQVEMELLRYTKELERSNQELDDFAYIASHDLKEPLRGLFNHATFLLEDYAAKLDEDGVRRLNRLAHLSQRMEHLVNDLLYFSRLGRTELAIQETDLNLIVSDIEQMMEATLKEKNAHIRVPKKLPAIVCDRPRITEVFRNLITNAVKYNDKAERMVEIGYLENLETLQGTENSVFYVKDNGVGIAPEFYQEIFRIFRRLQRGTESKEEGTGVGLTFVKKIIERHKGRIWLESMSGQGTVFYFTLGRR